MNQEDLLNLIKELDNSALAYFNYETKEVKLTLAKEMPQQPNFIQPIERPVIPQSEPVNSIVEESLIRSEAEEIEAEEETSAAEGEVMESPMVGVAYLQPKPGSDPYVKVGDTVEEGDVILIIEAMKLMNEIQADRSGVVTEILVENETVVEYGQPLIRIK